MHFLPSREYVGRKKSPCKVICLRNITYIYLHTSLYFYTVLFTQLDVKAFSTAIRQRQSAQLYIVFDKSARKQSYYLHARAERDLRLSRATREAEDERTLRVSLAQRACGKRERYALRKRDYASALECEKIQRRRRYDGPNEGIEKGTYSEEKERARRLVTISRYR